MSSNKQRILTRSAASEAVRQEIDNEGIDAFGIAALVGYEAETNHCIGLCTATYTDYHFHMALASTDTYTYRTRSKHRLIYACMRGNAKWFNLLWKAGSVKDMIRVRRKCEVATFVRPKKENLVFYLLQNIQEDGKDPHPDTLNRLTILRKL